MFDFNKFLKDNTITEKFIFLIGIFLIWAFGWLSRNFPFARFFTTVTEKVTPQYLLILCFVLFLVFIMTLLYAFQLSRKLNAQRIPPEFFARYNLNWKKTGHKIDPHPYCLCCPDHFPLQEHDTHSDNQDCEYFRCIHSREESGHRIDGISHWAKKDGKPISYKEAYLLVCKEFKIKPSKVL